MGFSLGGIVSSAASWVGDKVEGAVKEGAEIAHDVADGVGDAVEAGGKALQGAQHWVGDRLDDVDHAKDWVGGKIDGAVQGAEHAVDGFRKDLVQFGQEHGGFVGKALAEDVSNSIGLVEGAGLAVYDMGKGVVQLADGASKLVNPLEWATHADRNVQRLETVGKAGVALENLTNPAAWLTDPGRNVDTAKALWNGVTAGYQDAAKQGDWSKFVGRGVVDIGSLFIGVGEANAALKGAEGANAVAKLGEGANALDKVADGTRALDAAGDAGKAADAADAAGKSGKLGDAGDAVKFGRSVEQDRALLNQLSKAGKIDEARALLKPLVESGDLDGVIARLDVAAPKNGAYFWSGAKDEAGAIAKANGGVTLETTPGGRIVDGWKDIDSAFPFKNADGTYKPITDTFWGKLSQKYAESARGEVHIVQSPDKFPNGGMVWQQVELPALKEGLKTGRISEIHDPVVVAK